MDFIKKNYKYLLIFIISFICTILFRNYYYDSAIQYGMAHAIRIGEIPYVDFNTVSTPFYLFVCAFFLLFFDNYITYIIVNSIMLVLVYYFLDKIIKYHKLTFFLMSLLPFLDIFAPSYNMLCKLLIVLLLYCEKKEKKDIWIGMLLGLLIITKHSVGLAVSLAAIMYSILNHKHMVKRIIGMMIPVIIFGIYLLLTHSLYDFIDLCILGLRVFNNQNAYGNSLFIIVSIILAITLFIFIIRDKKSCIPYYALASISFVIPICDHNHFACFFIFFCTFLFEKYNLKIKDIIFNPFLMILLCITNYINKGDCMTNMNLVNYPHYYLLAIGNPKEQHNVLKEYKKYDRAIILSPDSMIYDTILDKKITFYDLPLTGNYGHLGTNRMINSLPHNTYYFIDDIYSNFQFDEDLCLYIMKKAEYVDQVSSFSIYYLK